jgi:hypothetical protein
MKKYLPHLIVGGVLVAVLIGILSFRCHYRQFTSLNTTNDWYRQNATQDWTFASWWNDGLPSTPTLSTSLEGTDVD